MENRLENAAMTFVVEPDGPCVYIGDNNQRKISGMIKHLILIVEDE